MPLDRPPQPFPEIKPFDSRTLPVGDGHELYLEQVGNPEGIPAVVLHGGPGSGCNPGQRRLFDPQRFRVVLFDQRGCGKSRPKGSLSANTTQYQIADLERIRDALGIERWMLVGGSWGALLAIAYAEAHPERVGAIALRALFLGSAAEIEWAFVRGPKIFRPDLWRSFLDRLPEAERGDPLAGYGRRLEDPDPAVHRPAAHLWHDYERALSLLTPERTVLSERGPAAGQRWLPTTPFFEWHYMKHGFFLTPEQLLRDAHRLAGIPGAIVQGRFDLLCPPRTAYALAARWPGCDLRIVEGAGHDAGEPGIGPALMAAIERLGRGLS